VAVLFDLAREINRAREENYDVTGARKTLIELAQVLGFTLEEPAKPPLDAEPFIGLLSQICNEIQRALKESDDIVKKVESLLAGATQSAEPLDAEHLIQLLIQIRDGLRQAKQWQLADMVRNRLIELGITLEDTPKETVWKRTL
jgi:cysteinyl-tRNA synthetase